MIDSKNGLTPRTEVQKLLNLPEMQSDRETMEAIGEVLVQEDVQVMQGVLADEFLMTEEEIAALGLTKQQARAIAAEDTPKVINYLMSVTPYGNESDTALKNVLIKNLTVLAVQEHISPLKNQLNTALDNSASQALIYACTGNQEDAFAVQAIISEDQNNMTFGELRSVCVGNYVQELTSEQRKQVERAMESGWKEHSIEATRSVWSLIRLYKETLGFESVDQVVQAMGYESAEALKTQMKKDLEFSRGEYLTTLANDGITANFANPSPDLTFWDVCIAKQLKDDGELDEESSKDNTPSTSQEKVVTEFQSIAALLDVVDYVANGKVVLAAEPREGKEARPQMVWVSTPNGIRCVVSLYPMISEKNKEYIRMMIGHELTHCKQHLLTEEKAGKGALAYFGRSESEDDALAMLVERQLMDNPESEGRFKGDSSEAVKTVRQAALAEWMTTAMQELFQLHDQIGARDLSDAEAATVNEKLSNSYQTGMSRNLGVHVGPGRWAYEILDQGMPQSAVYVNAQVTLEKLEEHFESKYDSHWIQNKDAIAELDAILSQSAVKAVSQILES